MRCIGSESFARKDVHLLPRLLADNGRRLDSLGDGRICGLDGEEGPGISGWDGDHTLVVCELPDGWEASSCIDQLPEHYTTSLKVTIAGLPACDAKFASIELNDVPLLASTIDLLVAAEKHLEAHTKAHRQYELRLDARDYFSAEDEHPFLWHNGSIHRQNTPLVFRVRDT